MTAPDWDAIENGGKRWHGQYQRTVHVRWEPYKPDGQRQMKAKGRWQEQVGDSDYWRWQNCQRPADLAPAPQSVPEVRALVEAAKSGLRFIENTEGELGIVLGCGDALRAAIAALPAVTVGAYTRTGVMDKDGREICVGDRIMIDLSGNATKREYWRPEYEVVFKPPHFTLKHVGGDKDSDTARLQWNVPQRSSTERITTLSIATLELTPAPDAAAIREAVQGLAAFLDAKHQSYVAAKGRNPADYVSGYSIARDKANAILDLIGPKGGA